MKTTLPQYNPNARPGRILRFGQLIQRQIANEIEPLVAASRAASNSMERIGKRVGRPLGSVKHIPDTYSVSSQNMPELAFENEPRFAAIVEASNIADATN